MSKPISLPMILVSAKTSSAASKLISEIIDEEGSNAGESKKSGDREWFIENKYYTARVALRAVGDEDSEGEVGEAAEPELADLPQEEVGGGAEGHFGEVGVGEEEEADEGKGEGAEAHVVLLQRGEGVPEAARRLARAPRSALALLAVDAERTAPELAAWAAAARLEPVELRARSPPPAAPRPPFGCERGVRRLREALHAHVWPGLRRRPPPPRPSHGEAGPGPGPGPETEAEMERFAAAAAALAAAARLPRDERRAHAEALVCALSRALRIPLDDL